MSSGVKSKTVQRSLGFANSFKLASDLMCRARVCRCGVEAIALIGCRLLGWPRQGSPGITQPLPLVSRTGA